MNCCLCNLSSSWSDFPRDTEVDDSEMNSMKLEITKADGHLDELPMMPSLCLEERLSVGSI